MRELGPYMYPLRDCIGYLIPSFPTKNQPVKQGHIQESRYTNTLYGGFRHYGCLIRSVLMFTESYYLGVYIWGPAFS